MVDFNPPQPPNLTNRKTSASRILTAKFGDGYEQRIADGINHNPVRWALTWNAITNAEADAIWSALEGYQISSFSYAVPGDQSRTYVVVVGTLTRGHVSAAYDTISVEIREVSA